MLQNSFPKNCRLRKRAEYRKLLNATYKKSVKGFLVVWEPNTLFIARVGLTVSKKVGSSVVRNKIKRYLREIFRHKRLNLPAVDINIIPRRDAANMDFKSVELEISRAFGEIISCSKK